MKLIDLKSKYFDYFGLYADFYSFDDLFGSKNIDALLNYFNQEGYQFESFTISFKGDHSDINEPISASSVEELFSKLNEIDNSNIELIDTFGFHNDETFDMQIYPNSNYVKVDRIKKKELSDEKQL